MQKEITPKVITVTEQCHGDVGLQQGSNVTFNVTSVIHRVMFTTALTGVNFGNTPNDLAQLILEFASGGGTEPTQQEIDSVARVIIGIHQRSRTKVESLPLMVTRVIEG